MLARWFSLLKVSALFAGLAAFSPFCISQTADQAKRVGEYYAHAEDFSGNVVVVRDGVIVSNNCYGKANVELGVPNTASTRYAIGSISKQFSERHIPLATLTRYTGTYSIPGATQMNPVVIEFHEGHLLALQKDRPTSTLIPRSDHEFYTKEWDGEVEFHQDHDGGWLMDLFILPRQTVMNMKQTMPAPH